MLDPALTADALRETFPACADAPLALTLVRLLARGQPVTKATLAAAGNRATDEVAAQLARWPNIERDADDAVVGFSGLTLRPTAHSFQVEGRPLHAWCAWDTLFLPRMLGATAHVRSTCPVSGRAVELIVAPDGVEHTDPEGIHADPSEGFAVQVNSKSRQSFGFGARLSPNVWLHLDLAWRSRVRSSASQARRIDSGP